MRKVLLTIFAIGMIGMLFLSQMYAQTDDGDGKDPVRRGEDAGQIIPGDKDAPGGNDNPGGEDPEYIKRRAELERRAAELGIPVREEAKESLMELQGFSKSGIPQYYSTWNSNAAQTISTDRVHPGGSSSPYNFSLTGIGQILGEWDGGAVRGTHQEFGGRVTQMDGVTTTHYHATHVAGTMIASGVVAAAKGMSFQGFLNAYDWNNDVAEMTAAGAGGLKVSNHSYGYITGWYRSGSRWYWFGDVNISPVEDYNFGYYDANAATWDGVAVGSPNYLIVKSAGNDRGSGPAAGSGHYYWDTNSGWTWSTATRDRDGGTAGYDCISHSCTSKNILTVGAVNDIPGGWTQPSDVVMSSFSGWGPTDDGRIKPDVVANGIGLYSTYNSSNTAYASFSGTSMSSPNTSGSIGLLHEHQENLHPGQILRSATMKALLIATADEAGTNAGPDYRNGWGLVNTFSAAKVISDHAATGLHIYEYTLAQGSTITLNVYSDGTPLQAAICWTDPVGTPAQPSLNPTTPMLVNDLDLRISNSAPATWFPWTLNPASPASAASTADNVRDNVEVVYVASPVGGTMYTVTISHKGTLSGSLQHVSLIVTGNQSSNNPPVADAGPDQTTNCVLPTGMLVTLDGSGSSDPDNDPLTYTWRIGATVIAGPTTNALSQVTLLPGVYTITLTVDDGNGATDTDDVIITMNGDTTPPTITAPAAVSASNDPGVCGTSLANINLGAPIVTDDCPNPTYANDAPGFFPVGSTTVTWTATDASGNTASAVQTVTVLDTEPPAITAPAAMTDGSATDACGKYLVDLSLGSATFSDNCPGATVSNDAPVFFPVGITTVTWTATDAHGNSTSAAQIVTIIDDVPPTISAPQDMTQGTDPGQCGRSSLYLGTPTVEDNCVTVTVSNDAPAWYPVGTTLITWTVVDAHGNSASASQNVIIKDTENPVLSVTIYPGYLYPANQVMRTINAYVSQYDNCPNSYWVLQSVASNEADNGLFPGDLPGDIVASTGSAATQIALRAETSPYGFGRRYSLRYQAIDATGNTHTVYRFVMVPRAMWTWGRPKDVVFSDDAVVPATPELSQNYPNPFTRTTSLTFRLPEPSDISLRVYNSLGREVGTVVEGNFGAGTHTTIFNANNLPDGMYFYKLVTGSDVIQKKMMLMR